MEPEPKNQKEFIVHSDKNHEWIYNGKDMVSISFETGIYFSTNATIQWRGLTFHVKISIPSRVTISTNANYSIIFNEKIYYPRIVGHYAFRGNIKDKPPVIETDEYYLEIYCGLKSFTLVEKLKPIETILPVLTNENKPEVSNSIVLTDENKPEVSNSFVLTDENKPVKFSDLFRRLFSKKQMPEINEPEKSEPKQIDPVVPEKPVIEDKIMRVCPFRILEASEEIKFEYPEKRHDTISVCTDQVTLYDNGGGSVFVNSYAYFEKEDFVVDFWKLGYTYEDEYFIIIDNKNVSLLFKEFKIESENKSELLIGILNAFNGKDCFEKYEKFLDLKKIPHYNNVRHDEKLR